MKRKATTLREDFANWYTLEVKQGMAVSRALFPTKAKAIRAGKAMMVALNTEVRVWKGWGVSPRRDTSVLWGGLDLTH